MSEYQSHYKDNCYDQRGGLTPSDPVLSYQLSRSIGFSKENDGRSVRVETHSRFKPLEVMGVVGLKIRFTAKQHVIVLDTQGLV